MALHPVGPLPAATYWRRRLVLLVVVVGLLLVARWALSGSPPPTRTAAGGPSAPSGSPAASLAPNPSPSPAASPPASPAATGACPDGSLQVSATADAATYRAGSAARLTLTVRNTGPVACRRTVAPGSVELQVLSGSDRIWSSADCPSGGGQTVLTLAPGAAQAMTVIWSGKRSSPGCRVGAVAQPGTYRVVPRFGSITGAGSVFTITA